MLTLRMCLSTEMNAKISATICTIRAFPTAPLCYMKLNRQVFNKEVATKKNISRVDRAPRKSALLNAKSSRHPSGGRSNQPRSQLSLLQRRVKKTRRTITVGERGRASASEDEGHPPSEPVRPLRSHPMEAASRVKAENGLEETRGNGRRDEARAEEGSGKGGPGPRTKREGGVDDRRS